MKRFFIVFTLVMLASSCTNPTSVDTASDTGGPTGCASQGICDPCTVGCTANRGAGCISQGCSINIVCIDNPPNCTKKCRVNCLWDWLFSHFFLAVQIPGTLCTKSVANWSQIGSAVVDSGKNPVPLCPRCSISKTDFDYRKRIESIIELNNLVDLRMSSMLSS